VIPRRSQRRDFYEKVFGWTVSRMCRVGLLVLRIGQRGGAFSNGKPAVGAMVLVLHVDDMDAALSRVVEFGGHVTRGRSEIGEAASGFDAYFVDPNGNEMGLFSETDRLAKSTLKARLPRGRVPSKDLERERSGSPRRWNRRSRTRTRPRCCRSGGCSPLGCRREAQSVSGVPRACGRVAARVGDLPDAARSRPEHRERTKLPPGETREITRRASGCR
jgi:predicted enzyme related to lactoylglutathione lyase